MNLRYLVKPLDGKACTYKTIGEAARALLDCDGRSAPVCVVMDTKQRGLTQAELRRLGQGHP
jgi:hypothetical protein